MISTLGPYELNSIIHGDCLEVMPGIPDKSIDLLLSDWPYGTTACEWDSVIPLEPLWKEAKRIIKDNGAIVLTAAQPFTSVLVMSNLKWFRYDWVWKKRRVTRFLDVSWRPLLAHESVLLFSQGSGFTYNPQMEPGEKHKRNRNAKHTEVGLTDGYGFYEGQGEYWSNEYYPLSVVEFGADPETTVTLKHRPKKTERHPTQKPVALFSYLIKTYSNPGDLILDNAAGSCTTAIAAIETGRNWLCIEQKAEYVEIGRKRVEERLKQPFLTGLIEAPRQPEPIQMGLGVD